MKTRLLLFLSLAVPGILLAADAPTNKAAGFTVFKLVRTRNLFDPNRQPMTAPSANKPSGPVRTRANFLALNGTLITGQRALAFFNGGTPELSKVVTVGDTHAGFKVASITRDQVVLEKDGKATPLAIGAEMPLQGMAEIPVATPAETPATDASGQATASQPGTPASGGDSSNDVLRRLMERRQKELSK